MLKNNYFIFLPDQKKPLTLSFKLKTKNLNLIVHARLLLYYIRTYIRHYALADIFIHLLLYLLAGVHPMAIIAVKMWRTALTLLVVFIARCRQIYIHVPARQSGVMRSLATVSAWSYIFHEIFMFTSC